MKLKEFIEIIESSIKEVNKDLLNSWFDDKDFYEFISQGFGDAFNQVVDLVSKKLSERGFVNSVTPENLKLSIRFVAKIKALSIGTDTDILFEMFLRAITDLWGI